MKPGPAQSDLSISEQAARWLLEIEEGGPEVPAEFTEWLKASPVHVDEFLMVTSVWRAFDGMDAAKRIDVERMLEAARAVKPADISGAERVGLARNAPGDPRGLDGAGRMQGDARFADAGANANGAKHPAGAVIGTDASSVKYWERIGAGTGTMPHCPSRPRAFWLPRRALLGFGFATALILGCMALWLLNSSARTYATTTGEQRAFKLEDGSIIHLNTQSRVTVDFSTSMRTVRLLEGEALFTVERDPKRPFRVEAGGVVFQAVGTQFNVYRHANTTTISVVEGVVQILPQAPSVERLAAGEQADVTGSGRIAKHPVKDLEQVTAWRQRRLVFRGDLLADVAREFNRYNQLRIVIESPEIRAKRLTGVFNADDPESLVLFLAGDSDLVIDTSPNTVRIRRR